jgi:hypothetical protein
MLDYTHFEALGHLSLLPLSSPQSSRSFGGREELPTIFHFHLPPKVFDCNFSKVTNLNFLNVLIEIQTPVWQPGLLTIRPIFT